LATAEHLAAPSRVPPCHTGTAPSGGRSRTAHPWMASEALHVWAARRSSGRRSSRPSPLCGWSPSLPYRSQKVAMVVSVQEPRKKIR
jgi:hypothetical protein